MLQIHVLQQYMTVNCMWGKLQNLMMKIENTIFPSWMVLRNHSDGPKRITEGGILWSIDNPVTHRKTRNIFIFSAKDLEKVQDMFDEI